MPLRPTTVLGLVLLPLVVGCMWLGYWQLERMWDKRALFEEFDQAVELELPQALAGDRLFARVRVSGQYDPDWHLLLDNKIQNGQVGVHVLTLFHADHGGLILVNRGWLPMSGDRGILPEIPTPTGSISISGILAQHIADGIKLGEPDNLANLSGPRLITYLDMTELVKSLHAEVSSQLILLNSLDPTGFGSRNWKPAVMLPAQHTAYAIQWFGFAIAMIIIWVSLAWKWRGNGKNPCKATSKISDQNPS